MDVRDLMIDVMTQRPGESEWPGVALAVRRWLGLHPVRLVLVGDRFMFYCHSHRDAMAIDENLGGDTDHKVCAGSIADLTG